MGRDHLLPLLHLDKDFFWINETKKHIIGFKIGYMINPGLNVNETFREQVVKCMLTKFGSTTQPFIKATLLKK